jgi:hypothetical protein
MFRERWPGVLIDASAMMARMKAVEEPEPTTLVKEVQRTTTAEAGAEKTAAE